MNLNVKRVVVAGILICAAAALWWIDGNRRVQSTATYSQFLRQVQAGEVNSAIIVAAHSGANPVRYRLKNGSRAATVLPSDYRAELAAMQEKLVNIEIRDASSQWPRLIANVTPFAVLMGVWLFMMARLKQKPETN